MRPTKTPCPQAPTEGEYLHTGIMGIPFGAGERPSESRTCGISDLWGGHVFSGPAVNLYDITGEGLEHAGGMFNF